MLKKAWEIVRKYWMILIAAGGFILGFLLRRSHKPIGLGASQAEPPKPLETRDAVEEYKDEKEKSDASVDTMDRDDLIDDINSRYD